MYYRRRYRWPHPVLFIAGLPKSGTTWLAQLLAEVPGYRSRWPRDPDGCLLDHDICSSSLASLPWQCYTVLKLHTRPSTANLQLIDQFRLPTVVMYRDPRDQAVSRYFHALHDPTHRHHAQYQRVSKEDGLAHCIELVIDESIPWIRGWLQAMAEHPGRFLGLRYGELRRDTVGQLARVLQFYGIALPGPHIQAIVDRVGQRTKFDLPRNLRTRRGTARKGMIGDWRNHFTRRHADRMAQACGDLLIAWGFERDPEWMRTVGSTPRVEEAAA